MRPLTILAVVFLLLSPLAAQAPPAGRGAPPPSCSILIFSSASMRETSGRIASLTAVIKPGTAATTQLRSSLILTTPRLGSSVVNG